jgi:hypothetical protein
MKRAIALVVPLIIAMFLTSGVSFASALISKVYADGGNLYFESPGANYWGCTSARFVVKSTDFRVAVVLTAFSTGKKVTVAPGACLNNSAQVKVIYVDQ